MNDEADIGNENMALALKLAVKQRKPEGPPFPTGKCLNCSTPVKGRRWCNSACRDDWQKEQGSD